MSKSARSAKTIKPIRVKQGQERSRGGWERKSNEVQWYKQEMTHIFLPCALWKSKPPTPRTSLLSIRAAHGPSSTQWFFALVPTNHGARGPANLLKLPPPCALFCYCQNKQPLSIRLLGKTAYICIALYMCNVREFVQSSYYCWTCSFQTVSYYTQRKAKTVRARLHLSCISFRTISLCLQNNFATLSNILRVTHQHTVEWRGGFEEGEKRLEGLVSGNEVQVSIRFN